jgi:hypothetical protein
VTHELAKELSEQQFERFEETRRAFEAKNPVSDFDKQVKGLEDRRKKKRNKGGDEGDEP